MNRFGNVLVDLIANLLYLRMEFKIPSERQKQRRPQLSPRDRVAAPATLWYDEGHPISKKYPKLYGSIITCTELSAEVFWDMEEKRSTIATEKLELLPKETPLQLEESDTEPDRAIFHKKPRRSRMGKQKKAKQIGSKVPEKVSESLSDDMPEDQEETVAIKNPISPIRIVNKTRSKKKNIILNKKGKQLFGRKQLTKPTAKSDPEPDVSSDSSTSSTDGSDESSAEAEIAEEESFADDDLFKFKLKAVKINYAANSGHALMRFPPRLVGLVDNKKASPLDHFILFCPREYIEQVILAEANKEGSKKFGVDWKEITFGEFLTLFGILLFMETVVLPEQKDYWETTAIGPYIAQNMGRFMTRERFVSLLSVMTVFLDPESIKKKDLQAYWTKMNSLVEALTSQFQKALLPGTNLTLDESMIKSYHRNLPGKIKIKRKPTPVGNEILDLCDSDTLIVLTMEFNQGKESNAAKEFVKEYGATTAAALRLTRPFWGTGRIVYEDSWFGSVKLCEQLLQRGLYTVGLVKTAHKNYPKSLLGTVSLKKGEWCSTVPTSESAAKLWCCRYVDRKPFQFVASCSTSLEGTPRIDSHKNEVKRPQVASDYFKNAGAIDRFNHCRTGGFGLENAVRTKDPSVRQLCGLLGFVETNSYLSYRYFTKEMKHKDFKRSLVCLLLQNNFDDVRTPDTMTRAKRRTAQEEREDAVLRTHYLRKNDGLRNQKRCFYCYHAYETPRPFRTVYYCDYCGDKYGICSPTTGRKCWDLHIKNGLPLKRKRSISKPSQ